MRRPSHATLVAYLALFVALGGTAYAAAKIGSAEIRDNSIRSVDVRNGTLRGRDVGANALGGREIAEAKLGTVPAAAKLGTLGPGDVITGGPGRIVTLSASGPDQTITPVGGLPGWGQLTIQECHAVPGLAASALYLANGRTGTVTTQTWVQSSQPSAAVQGFSIAPASELAVTASPATRWFSIVRLAASDAPGQYATLTVDAYNDIGAGTCTITVQALLVG